MMLCKIPEMYFLPLHAILSNIKKMITFQKKRKEKRKKKSNTYTGDERGPEVAVARVPARSQQIGLRGPTAAHHELQLCEKVIGWLGG
jgi:hypothetical protein